MSETDTDVELGKLEFGYKRWIGIAGLLGGILVTAAGVYAAMNTAWGTGGAGARGSGKLTGYLILFGLLLLGGSFKVKGCALNSDGLNFWSYFFWVIGSKRTVAPHEISHFSLGERNGKFTVTVKFADGEHEIPQQWAALKDAQAVIDFGNRCYGAEAEVAITDSKMLNEAAAFAKANRLEVRPVKATGDASERLVFSYASNKAAGEVRVLKRFFRTTRATIPEAVGEAARWKLAGRFWGRHVRVQDGDSDAMDIKIKAAFLGQSWTFQWRDEKGIVWSAVMTTEVETRTPFTMKMYRGLADGVGSASERTDCGSTQGEPVVVAIANGPANDFSLDVADDSGWAWMRLALGAMWIRCRPSYSFKKA